MKKSSIICLSLEEESIAQTRRTFTSEFKVEILQGTHIHISMADVGAAWQNGHTERLIRTIKEEEEHLTEYRGHWEAYNKIERFLEDVYMHRRIPSALGYLTPVEFEVQWFALCLQVACYIKEFIC